MELNMLPRLAFDVLLQSESLIAISETRKELILELLHSFFGEHLVLASELLEKCKIYQYSTENSRRIFKIITSKEQYTIYDNINFCVCDTFSLQVLELMNSLTCKHVLAVHLGKMTNRLIQEEITGSQFVDFLNEQLTSMVNLC